MRIVSSLLSLVKAVFAPQLDLLVTLDQLGGHLVRRLTGERAPCTYAAMMAFQRQTNTSRYSR